MSEMDFNSPDMVKTFYEKVVDKRIENSTKNVKYDKSFSATVMSVTQGTVGIKLLGATNTISAIPNKTGEILSVGDEVYVEAINGSSNNMVVKYKKGSDGMGSFMNGVYRQAIINGNFDVWQRGTTLNTIASLSYAADRWKHLNNTDNNVRVLRSVNTPNSNSQYSMRLEQMTSTGGINAYTDTIQLIEDSALFRGKKVTFSGWVKADSGVTITTLISDGVGATAGDIITSTNWTFISVTHEVSALASSLYPLIRFFRDGQVAGKGINIAQMQLNLGDTALPFQPRSFGDEILLCQRYYFKTFSYGTPPSQNSGLNGALMVFSQAATTFGTTLRFPVQMRIRPTVTTYNPLANNANWRETATGIDKTASTDRSNEKQVAIFGSSGGNGTENVIHVTADAEL